MIDRLRRRLSTRVAAATSALALLFLACMGVGAWVAAAAMMRAEMERQVAETARARALQAADLIGGIAVRMAAEGPALAGAETPVGANVAGVPLILRLAAIETLEGWDRAPLRRGSTAGRLSSVEGSVEMAVPLPSAKDAERWALVWSAPLAGLAGRLGNADSAVAIALAARVAGRTWASPSSLAGDFLTHEADVVLPAGFGGGQLLVLAGADPGQFRRPLERFALWRAVNGVVGTLLAVTLAVITSRRLTRTLSGLADTATSYAFDAGRAGDFQVAGDDEIARLGKAFAGMVARLDLAYRDLDRRGQALLSNAERVAQVGSATWEPGHDTHQWSDQFHAILGLGPGAVVPGRAVFFDHVHPDDRVRLAAALDAALAPEGGRVLQEVRVLCGDGAERVAQFRAEVTRSADGRPLRVDATIQDITERKQMEEQLDGVVRELQRSNEELEQFAYVASHDLRQPLRTVRSYLSLIEDAIDDKLDDETREFMDFIRDGVKRMDSLITDLLAYSRVGRVVADGPVDTGRIIDLALLDLQAEIDDTRAGIDLPASLPVVEGDAGEMTRLFQNLVGNALKYRDPDQEPHIVVRCHDRGALWEFGIADNGIGIPADQRERIFGIFQRLHGRHEYEGTGIGLAICRKVVERRGGAIWVEDTPGGGTTFRFTWPKLRRAGGRRR